MNPQVSSRYGKVVWPAITTSIESEQLHTRRRTVLSPELWIPPKNELLITTDFNAPMNICAHVSDGLVADLDGLTDCIGS